MENLTEDQLIDIHLKDVKDALDITSRVAYSIEQRKNLAEDGVYAMIYERLTIIKGLLRQTKFSLEDLKSD